ncbi:hypothetical protein JOM56_002614 [Amanita muscaria]
MLVWGVFLALAWIAYTTLNTASQFADVARMDKMHTVSIFMLVASVSVAFGTLLVVVPCKQFTVVLLILVTVPITRVSSSTVLIRD